MHLLPATESQKYYRGNLHGHSTHSDGKLEAEEVIEFYKSLGYDFTCLSDHLWQDERFSAKTVLGTQHLNSNNFITINSAEIHCRGKKYDNDGLWHIVANGLPLDFAVASDDETAPQLVQRAVDAGAYVTIAHPEWYTLTCDEAMAISHAHGVEIYNHGCVVAASRGSGIGVADYLLQEGKRISFTATDDSHFNIADAGGGWVMVAADELSPHAIVNALKTGQHYSSTGVEIRLFSYDEGKLYLSLIHI